ncbi:MAG: 4-hydroxy-tetrahydrodipicolinate synthase [Leptospirales bacterium]|nr:4-hydroxy-tetrahydrodipicolinate synthase [Leptospirales bacterium]
MEFKGVFTALITPLQNQGRTIDFGALRELVERQAAAGVKGVVPCGTTGESPTLSHQEHAEVIRKTVEYARGRLLVVAGAGSNATAEAIQLTADACAAGVDGVMLVSPYYNKPSQDGLIRHFQAVADASTVPVMLYNIRGRTAVNIEVETLQRLIEHPRIQAIKEASGDPAQMTRIIRYCGSRVAMLSGDDNLIPAVMGIGGQGVVSVASNLYPRRMVRMMDLYLKGDFVAANQQFYELFDFMNALFWDVNPTPIKAAAHLRGLCNPELRLPLLSLDSVRQAQLSDLLQRIGEDS